MFRISFLCEILHTQAIQICKTIQNELALRYVCTTYLLFNVFSFFSLLLWNEYFIKLSHWVEPQNRQQLRMLFRSFFPLLFSTFIHIVSDFDHKNSIRKSLQFDQSKCVGGTAFPCIFFVFTLKFFILHIKTLSMITPPAFSKQCSQWKKVIFSIRLFNISRNIFNAALESYCPVKISSTTPTHRASRNFMFINKRLRTFSSILQVQQSENVLRFTYCCCYLCIHRIYPCHYFDGWMLNTKWLVTFKFSSRFWICRYGELCMNAA